MLSKKELADAYRVETGKDVDASWTKAQIEAALVEAEGFLEAEAAKREEIAKAMTSTLNRYKPRYKRVAKPGAKRKTQNNGDPIAMAMLPMNHKEVALFATEILELDEALWVGDGSGKYDHLNNGQVRMNSGNRIRQAIKRGDITAEAVLAKLEGRAEA